MGQYVGIELHRLSTTFEELRPEIRLPASLVFMSPAGDLRLPDGWWPRSRLDWQMRL
jgi:hypothetical protein